MTTTTEYTTSPGGELREKRLRLGLTQAQLANLAGCSLSMIGALEAGAVPRRSPTLARIHDVLVHLEREVILTS